MNNLASKKKDKNHKSSKSAKPKSTTPVKILPRQESVVDKHDGFVIIKVTDYDKFSGEPLIEYIVRKVDPVVDGEPISDVTFTSLSEARKSINKVIVHEPPAPKKPPPSPAGKKK